MLKISFIGDEVDLVGGGWVENTVLAHDGKKIKNNGLNPVVLRHNNTGVYITVNHNKLIISLMNATFFGPWTII